MLYNYRSYKTMFYKYRSYKIICFIIIDVTKYLLYNYKSYKTTCFIFIDLTKLSALFQILPNSVDEELLGVVSAIVCNLILEFSPSKEVGINRAK